MTLALVGAGEYLPPMEALDRELINRLDQPARVVCLPTAAGTEGDAVIRKWMRMGEAHFQGLGVEVEALYLHNRETAEDRGYADTIASANFVYLSGGKPDYLFNTLHGTPVWEAVQGVLAQGGVVAGCSAGAMIMGEHFFGMPRWKPGFGLVPGTIIPHFDELPSFILTPVRFAAAGRKYRVLGVDGYTALVKSGERYDVLGTGGVTIWQGRKKVRFTAGPVPAGEI